MPKTVPYCCRTRGARSFRGAGGQSDRLQVLLSDAGRKEFLQHWQERKREQLTHPYLEEKLPWGMVPYAQALLLARHLRGDLDGYPPFLWK